MECCPEGAIKVTALDEYPLMSLEVHLIAISLVLVQQGCHQEEISFHLGHHTWVSSWSGDIYGFDIVGQQQACPLCQLSCLKCPRDLPWFSFQFKAVSHTSVPPEREVVCFGKKWVTSHHLPMTPLSSYLCPKYRQNLQTNQKRH